MDRYEIGRDGAGSLSPAEAEVKGIRTRHGPGGPDILRGMPHAATFGVFVGAVGAAYLIVLGVQTILTREQPASSTAQPAALRQVFAQGVIVNVLNPHTALFFFAFLPQFVNPSTGRAAVQMLIFGLLFVGLSLTTDSGWAIAAGTAGDWIRGHPRFATAQRYVAGGALIGLGAAAALTGRRHR